MMSGNKTVAEQNQNLFFTTPDKMKSKFIRYERFEEGINEALIIFEQKHENHYFFGLEQIKLFFLFEILVSTLGVIRKVPKRHASQQTRKKFIDGELDTVDLSLRLCILFCTTLVFNIIRNLNVSITKQLFQFTKTLESPYIPTLVFSSKTNT